MPVVETKQILDRVLDYRNQLFTPEIVRRMDAYSQTFSSSDTLSHVIERAQPEAVQVIERLCNYVDWLPPLLYITQVPDRVRFAVFLRFQYFMEFLRTHDEAFVDLPSQFSLILRYGLLHLWEEGQILKNRRN